MVNDAIENNNNDKKKSTELSKMDEIEVNSLSDSLRDIYSMRTNVGIFFGTVNLGGMAFAIQGRAPIVAVFSGIFLWMFVFFEELAKGYVIANYYRLYQIREKYGIISNNEYLQVNYPKNITDEKFRTIIEESEQFDDDQERLSFRITALKELGWKGGIGNIVESGHYIGFYLPIILGFFEIGFGIYTAIYGFGDVTATT